jgi:hypothetical protein
MVLDLVPDMPGMVETIGDLSTWVADKGGGLVLKGLFQGYADELGEKLRKLIEEGEVKNEFERSRHGRSLLQEAMNALWTVRDQERAKAIQQVFLGLAMNPVEDSLEQVEQLQIIRTVAEMTTWEVMFCNALERYSKLAFQHNLAAEYGPWEQASNPDVAPAQLSEVQGLIQARVPRFIEWLDKDYCKGNEVAKTCLRRAADSLNQKMVLRTPHQGLEENRTWSALDKRGAFTEHGWKLAQHLYSAEVPTEVEVKEDAK